MMQLLPRPLWLSLAIPILAGALSIDCENIRVSGQSYNFKALKGAHTVHWVRRTPPTISNTTFTIDICEPIIPIRDKPKEDQCPLSTRVCGTTQIYHADEEYDPDRPPEIVITIAGDFQIESHRPLDPHWTPMKGSDSNADSGVEGLRLEMNGGLFPYPKDESSLPQKAIVEFICDKDRTGLEGESIHGQTLESFSRRKPIFGKMSGDDDDDTGDVPEPLPNPDEAKSITFISYKEEVFGSGQMERKAGVLRLNWQTIHACEGQADSENGATSGNSRSWGFFTWFIIIFFMAIAAYLIFGSWLNYNRHGARGWDLVPHSDTIRDVPYLLKDWVRRVIGTFQGGRDLGYIRV